MRAPSFAWSMWKRTSFRVTAECSFTGMLTSPKVSAPLQMALAMGPPGRTILPPVGAGNAVPRAGARRRFRQKGETMPGKRPSDEGGDAPRTDLPPTREPYTDDYFGTGEEEGVVRETDAPEGDPVDEAGDRGRRHA